MDFTISYDGLGRTLMAPLGLGKGHTTLHVDERELRLRMGWGFAATVPRANITGATHRPDGTPNRGAHGWRGRWLVNGSSKGLVSIAIDPPVRARTLGVPIRLRELIVSVDAPDDLVTALS